MDETALFEEIIRIEDPGLLKKLRQAIERRQAALEQEARTLRLRLQDGQWWLIQRQFEGERSVILCKQLSPIEVLERNKRRPPTPKDFQIRDQHAQSLMDSREGQKVGWFDRDDGSRAYYQVTPYLEARREWREWYQLARDDLAMTLGLSIGAVKKLRQLETEGWRFQFEEDGGHGVEEE